MQKNGPKLLKAAQMAVVLHTVGIQAAGSKTSGIGFHRDFTSIPNQVGLQGPGAGREVDSEVDPPRSA